MAQVSKTPVSDFDAAVRLLSGGTNVALYNDLGLPGVYVIKPKGNLSDVITTESMGVHPAFRVDGHEIDAFYMGKYLAAVYMGRALSLPLQDPSAYQVDASDKGDAPNTNVNFDNAKLWCEANGPGFHLPTLAEYAWIALLARKNETMPHGNTSYGASSDAAYEKGIGSTYGSDGRVNRTLTGSGPVTWNDNGKPDGISDICGNVWEWQGGYRIVEGELQFFADNDAAMQWQQNAESSLWKAMLPDGTLVAPGTAGTLKWDYTADRHRKRREGVPPEHDDPVQADRRGALRRPDHADPHRRARRQYPGAPDRPRHYARKRKDQLRRRLGVYEEHGRAARHPRGPLVQRRVRWCVQPLRQRSPLPRPHEHRLPARFYSDTLSSALWKSERGPALSGPPYFRR